MDIMGNLNAAQESFKAAGGILNNAAGKASDFARAGQRGTSMALGGLAGTAGFIGGAGVGAFSSGTVEGTASGALLGGVGAAGLMYGLSMNAGNISKGVGGAVLGASSMIGDAIVNPTTAKAAAGLAKVTVGTLGLTAATVLDVAGGIGNKIVKNTIGDTDVPKTTGKMAKLKRLDNRYLSGFGAKATNSITSKVLPGAFIAGSMINAAMDARNKSRMGTIDSRMVGPTADLAPYLNMNQGVSIGPDSASANGDLVFAMHNNRQGGYI